MLIKLLTYSGLLFSDTRQYVIADKKSQGLPYLHCLIPEKFKNHPCVRLSNYDINNGYNIIYSSSTKINFLKYDYQYNKFIENVLDKMFMNSKYSEHEMCKLNNKLRHIGMRKLSGKTRDGLYII